MSALPRISIVTPTLNQAEFIRATIDSVLEQGYPALDYSVRDGGSTDGTLEILRSYGTRLKWVSAPDGGQSAAINAGWRDSSGEIMAYLNSDDLYTPGALLRVGEFFAAHPEIDLLYGDCDEIDAAGKVTGAYPARAYDYLRLVRDAVNFIPQPAVFFRRRVWEAIGALDESLHYVMDFDYWLRAGVHFRAAYLPERLAALRLHAGAKSVAQVSGFGAELERVYRRLFAQPHLPAEIKAIERQALGNVYARAADTAFWSGDLAGARQYAWQAWQRAPLRPRGLWLWIALGRPGRWLAERMLGNPYLPK